jgi:hypothetical protein
MTFAIEVARNRIFRAMTPPLPKRRTSAAKIDNGEEFFVISACGPFAAIFREVLHAALPYS